MLVQYEAFEGGRAAFAEICGGMSLGTLDGILARARKRRLAVAGPELDS